jgi:transcriptional regulator with PAS, ATPase and Fis domain
MSQELTQEQLGIIGRAPSILEIVDTTRRVAPTDITVLLVGESGVGKEIFASAIHKLSRRASSRMIAINCGAIPETLLESELFGHEKGAFTGAVETRKGLFEAARGGTIFLDEIGEMTLATQVKLLRVLEAREFTRVGSTEPHKTDVRVIAATNVDLDRAVASGTFRQDLYYRLRSVQLRIPPLRDRREDIPLLFAHFAYATSNRLGIEFGGITPEALRVLIAYPWPGNIRELRNLVELLLTLEAGKLITEDVVLRHMDTGSVYVENPSAIVHLPGRTPEQAERELIYRALIELRSDVADLKRSLEGLKSQPQPEIVPRIALPAPAPTAEEMLEKIDNLRLDEMERQMITVALKRFNGNRRLAARALGISERTLYRKLKEYKLLGDDEEGEPGAEDLQSGEPNGSAIDLEIEPESEEIDAEDELQRFGEFEVWRGRREG